MINTSPELFAVAQSTADVRAKLESIGGRLASNTPIKGQKFYKLSGVVTVPNINATIYAVVLNAEKIGAVGAKVAGLRTDGRGQIELADEVGRIQIQLRASSIFNTAGEGAFSVFVVSDDAEKDEDSKALKYEHILSDAAISLGDWQGAHQEIHLQFIEVSDVIVPPPPPPPTQTLNFATIAGLHDTLALNAANDAVTQREMAAEYRRLSGQTVVPVGDSLPNVSG